MQIPVGGVFFFDSGIGGLTVLAECKRGLPGEIFYYYGDNFNAPYGNLPREKILTLVQDVFDRYAALSPAAAVLACNTATALCISTLRKRYAFPIIGAEPAVLPAAKQGGQVYVLCTQATANSERLSALLARARENYPATQIDVQPCPHLAGEIEKRVLDIDYDFTKFLPQGKPTSVVLGCTHYIYIKERVKAHYACPVYDGNRGIATQLQKTLSQANNRPFPFSERSVLQKNRENRPLVTHAFSSQTDGQNGAKTPSVFFLGDAKSQNERIFEQMFAKLR